ncbi:MAG: isoprenylcysteine carboxylmethyltransferase family protein [Desulfuromonadales bacterium]
MSAWWILIFLIIERLFELVLSRRNRGKMLARGGREYFPENYRHIVVLHISFFAALILESWPWRIPLDALTIFGLAALGLTMMLRYWCVLTLKEHWNTRIIVVPGAAPIRKGPYRFMRHPNYMAVTLEFAVIPLLLRAPLTLVVFTILNLGILRRRIALEEQALDEN